MLTLLLTAVASAATLPGIAVPFDVTDDGRWVLAENLPAALADAGAQPGWELREVDGMPFDDPDAVIRRVANGPARPVQLVFYDAPEGGAEDASETVVVASRSPLIRASSVRFVSWPEALSTPVQAWQEDPTGAPVVLDADGTAWALDASSGQLRRSRAEGLSEHAIPGVFWELSRAAWVLDGGSRVERGSEKLARRRLAEAARVPVFEKAAGEHLVVPEERGLRVWAVQWPAGTPSLPMCQPRVPETCLASGRQILRDLGDVPGGPEEARRQLGVACSRGVHRACYEAVALEEPDYAARVSQCIDGEIAACNDVAEHRYDFDPEAPSDLVVGLLEHACDLEGSGSLGQRLRRLEDIGASCMLLANAYDTRDMSDLALLNLDQACVLGRADACTEAEARREAAFAARTVRECTSDELPIPASCVELGRLQQETPVEGSPLDDFDAFLRGCELGAAEGCELLGDYVDRWGIDHPRVTEAQSRLARSCGTGEVRACLGQAHLLVRHEPRTTAYGQALELFASACKAGSAEACVAGARQRRIGDARQTTAPDRVTMYGAACDKGSPEGCAGLGDRLADSRSELEGAFTAYTQACELGDAPSCSDLGQLVQRRHAPPWEGEQPAATYLARGCDRGDPEGCFLLAEAQGLPRKGDPAEQTYVLLERACEGENGPGCARLAQVHLDRKSNFDNEIAARHLGTACENGFYESCRDLGRMYQVGKGVERDRQRASELYELFRNNAPRRHLRVGPTAGLPYGIGLEGEVVLPLPVGPGLSVGGHAAWLPLAGAPLPLLDGESLSLNPPNLRLLGVNARVYPNPQARGLYGSVGYHELRAAGGSLDEAKTRKGWNARVGIRSQTKLVYTSLEIGLGTYGVLDLNDFDQDEEGSLPVILPALGFSVGLALF